jgi:glycine/D-amino acid oxidase-like deaminating enzyme
LALAGFRVTVLEAAAQFCQLQSGPFGGQARQHGGTYYSDSPRVARALSLGTSLAREVPEAIRKVPARYFVSEAALPGVLRGWREARLWFRKGRADDVPISARFRQRHRLTAFWTRDQVIDPRRLRDRLERECRSAGCRLICRAEVVAGEAARGRLTAIRAQTPDGPRRFSCDFVVNVAGASLSRVLARLCPGADVSGHFKRVATPVLRAPWPFSFEPGILQFYGDQLLSHLSLIPCGFRRMVSVATSGGLPVPDGAPAGLASEPQRARLLGLLAEAFDLLDLPEPQTLSWCVKALLTHPEAKRREGAAGARLVTVIPGPVFGARDNVLIAAPGKLGSVLEFRDAVVAEVRRYFATGQPGLAA